MTRTKRKNGLRLLATAAAAGLMGMATAGESQAALVLDVRATSVASGDATVVDSKTVTALPGAVINYEIWAVVTGAPTNTALEGFQSAAGSLSSSSGTSTVQVDLAHQVTAGFSTLTSGTNPNAGHGTPTNLGGDMDIDIGVSLSPPANQAGNIEARSGSMTSGNASGLGESSFHWGGGTMTVRADNSLSNTTTSINFNKMTPAFNNLRPNWLEDGLTRNGFASPGSTTNTIGAPVQVSLVPEPAALGLLSLAGLAALRRRRA